MDLQPAATKARKALILEDDAWVAPIIESALKKALPDLQIDRAVSVDEAIAKTKKKNYEVIIADIFVEGGQTGVTFWDYCQKECPNSKMLLTSSMPIEEFEKNYSANRDDPLYVRKPLSIPELVNTVKALVDFTGVSS